VLGRKPILIDRLGGVFVVRRLLPTARDSRPEKPIFYGPFARLVDRQSGIKDGRAGILAMPLDAGAGTGPASAVSPFLEIRRCEFLDRSERERRCMERDLADVYQRWEALRREIAGADEAIAEIRKRLDDTPERPDEAALTRRNVVERDADEALVRARRVREHAAVRDLVVAAEREAIEAMRAMRIEEARLAESISSRERILDSRVRQLHEHTRRRCGTYKQHLVRAHPDGAAVIPYLDLALPQLPGWLRHPAPGRPAAAAM
jgi:hypothetical protein